MKLSGLSTSVPATAPVLVSQGSKDFGALLDIVFETNPMDGLCDARVRVASMPLQIVYDAVSFFRLRLLYEFIVYSVVMFSTICF